VLTENTGVDVWPNVFSILTEPRIKNQIELDSKENSCIVITC